MDRRASVVGMVRGKGAWRLKPTRGTPAQEGMGHLLEGVLGDILFVERQPSGIASRGGPAVNNHLPDVGKMVSPRVPQAGDSLDGIVRHIPATPRTDKLAGEWIACETVPASHARELERELAAESDAKHRIMSFAADLTEENARLLAGCARAEELISAGGYTKWQDGAWWIFWESNGEVAAGPAKSLYELAHILSNEQIT